MNSLGHALFAALTTNAPVALSGGLDSWVLALLLKRAGHNVQGYTLVSGVPGYCEWPQTHSLARQFQIPIEPIETSAAEFESALPRFLTITQTPIYNLHPVSKLLLAEGLAARNVTQIITGDAADQVFRCETICDLLPLTQACFRHQNIKLITPFLTPGVRKLCQKPDPDKLLLRELAAQLGLPSIPKRPTLFPGPNILQRTKEMLCAASPA